MAQGAQGDAWSYPARHPVAAELETLAPSCGLVARLDSLEVADLDDEAVLEVVAGWERVAAWAAAEQARAVAEMVRRARGSTVDVVPDEVAARLGTTRRAGIGLVTLAVCLEAHPPVADALAAGAIGARKAAVLLADTEHLPDHLVARVLAEVLPDADLRTVPQLRADLRSAELALAPEAAAVRHRVAARERCVRMVAAPDAMAWLHAFLPAADAQAVMTGIDAAAARSPEDARTADQRRADALTALALRVLDSGLRPDGTPVALRQHRLPHLEVTVSASTLAAGRGVARLASYGLVPFEAVRDRLACATAITTVVDEEYGQRLGGGPLPAEVGYRPPAALARQVVERDGTCRFPGCRVPAERCDLDHVVPFDPDRPAARQTTADNLHALCRSHHRLKTHRGWAVSRDPLGGATLWFSRTGRVYLVAGERAGPDPERPRAASTPLAVAG